MTINNYILFRQIIGFLFFLDLIFYLPFAKVCFGKGYWKTKGFNDFGLAFALTAWLLSSLSLITGFFPLIGSLVLFLLFRHLYIKNRWSSLFRGGGAPGFMSHHLIMFCAFFEISFFLDSSLQLSQQVLKLFRFDFAIILLCSGTYKSLSGYLKGEGMEYGLANPMWGYWHPIFKELSPENILLKWQDFFAAIFQVLMGIFLLIPPLQPVGAMMCIMTFFYLMFVVRLGRLAVLMMAAPLLYFPDLNISIFQINFLNKTFNSIHTPHIILSALSILIMIYMILLPIIKIMQYTNLFLNKTFRAPFQKILTKFANFVPIIMWRVFTPDVTNFFIRIYKINPSSNKEEPILDERSHYSYKSWKEIRKKLRFLHVTESITITTIFTTLRYFQSNRKLFEEKLIQYSKTLECDEGDIIKYQFVSIQKGNRSFEYVPITNFFVDLKNEKVIEERILKDFSYNERAKFSHIRESAGYGTYAANNR